METRNSAQQHKDSETAVTALKASKFRDAQREASVVLGKDPRNSRAAAVRAITAYQEAGNNLIVSLTGVMRHAGGLKFFDHQGARQAWLDFAKALDAIDKDLAVVAADRDFSMELCLACWEHDWNRSGEIDENDRKMFELEFDGNGGELAENDPRRQPTIHFDVGDAEWARAMIAFQRAAVELVLAYRWSELDKLFGNEDDGTLKITIHLADPGRVKHARELVVAGLSYADKCREAYLAESDDDREWVPNPRQKSYAMPLQVDDQLYQTWKGVLGDVRRLLASEEGISLREAKRLIDPSERSEVPDMYIDLGRMLREPKDIVFDIGALEKHSYETFLRGLIGNGYQTKMRPSPLVARLRGMKDSLDRGEDSLERKLRYLLWLN